MLNVAHSKTDVHDFVGQNTSKIGIFDAFFKLFAQAIRLKGRNLLNVKRDFCSCSFFSFDPLEQLAMMKTQRDAVMDGGDVIISWLGHHNQFGFARFWPSCPPIQKI